MASKTKKIASKKTVSKKAAAKKSIKGAALMSAKKAAKKTTKKAAKKGGGSGEVSHSPIIITDGSASIEFARNEYPTQVGSTHRSTGLQLTEIISDKEHSNHSLICHTLLPNETVEIEVTCKVGGSDPRTFIIRGGNFPNGSGSPSITFNHSVFNESMTPTAPTSEPRVRRGKKNRTITKMEIFKIVGGNREPVHDCDVIPKGDFEINVKDPHA